MVDILKTISQSKGTQVTFSVTAQDLENFAKDIFRKTLEEVRHHILAKEKEDETETLCAKDAAKYLNVCQTTLYNYVNHGLLGRIKVGGKARFRRGDLLAFKNGRYPPERENLLKVNKN